MATTGTHVLTADDAQRIAEELRNGTPTFLDFSPGNGSRYQILLTPIMGAFRPNDDWPSGISRLGFPVIVSLIGFGSSYQFDFAHGGFHAQYVAEKLVDSNEIDGAVIADVMNDVAEGLDR